MGYLEKELYLTFSKRLKFLKACYILKLAKFYQSMEAVLHFYRVAVSDWENAKCLYEKNSYSSAIYHLQQSVEKLAKAYCLFGGIIPFKDFKNKIGHLPHKIYKTETQIFKAKIDKAMLNKDVVPEFFAIPGLENVDWIKYQQSVAESSKTLQNLDSWEFHELEKQDIDYFLIESEKALEAGNDIDWNAIDSVVLKKKHLNALSIYLEGIKKYNLKEVSDLIFLMKTEEFTNLIYDATLYQIQIIPKVIYTNYSLLMLSLITSSHEETTRYPCAECGYNPLDYYVQGLEIVDKLPELLEWQSKTIKFFNELFLDSKDLNV